MKPFSTFVFSFLIFICAFTQQSPHIALGLQVGVSKSPEQLFSVDDWKTLAPDGPSTGNASFSESVEASEGMGWLELSLQVTAAKKWGNRLTPAAGISLGFGPEARETLVSEQNSTFPYDTLISSNGEFVYLDSSVAGSMRNTYRSGAALAGMRFLLMTNEMENGLSFSSGIGITVAFGFKGRVESTYKQASGVHVAGSMPAFQPQESPRLYTSAPPVVRLMVYVPLQLRFALFPDKLLEAYIEVAPMYSRTQVRGYDSADFTTLAMGFGFARRLPGKRPRTLPAYEARL